MNDPIITVHPDTRHLCYATGPDGLTYSFWFRGDDRVAEVTGPTMMRDTPTVGRNASIRCREPAADVKHAMALLADWASEKGYTIIGGMHPVQPRSMP